MAEGRLDGLVALVVGAGQTPGETIGNGRAIATTFAREGADVFCVDRVAERADETVASIRRSGGMATAVAADITDDEQCAAIVARVLADRGRIDVPGQRRGNRRARDGPAHRADPAAFERIIDVNLTAMWRMCRAALPTMREHRRGSIVNVSSAASFAGGFQVAYEVSKAGVNRLTTSIAQSNASRGVRCNAIALGPRRHPDGRRRDRCRSERPGRAGSRRAQRAGATARRDGDGLGCCERRARSSPPTRPGS